MKRIIYILLVCLAVSVCLCSCVGLTLVDGEGGYNEKAELSVDYVYQLAKDAGYSGTLKQIIAEFKGEPGADGVGIYNATFDERAHLILTLTNGSSIDCGKISINVNSSSSISIGENGNWYINNVDTGKRAEAIDGSGWHTGAGAPTADIGSDGDLYLEL